MTKRQRGVVEFGLTYLAATFECILAGKSGMDAVKQEVVK